MLSLEHYRLFSSILFLLINVWDDECINVVFLRYLSIFNYLFIELLLLMTWTDATWIKDSKKFDNSFYFRPLQQHIDKCSLEFVCQLARVITFCNLCLSNSSEPQSSLLCLFLNLRKLRNWYLHWMSQFSFGQLVDLKVCAQRTL